MKHSKHILFLSSIFCLLFYGCCKEDCTDDTNPDCPNYNPCKNLKEPTGKILRCLGKSELWSDSFAYFDLGDTFLITRSGGSYISVFCPDTGCTYEWTVGSETITDQGFFRQNIPANTPIEVTLKVTLKDPNNCIPADKRTKTTKRIFFGVENYDGKLYNYYGKWKGYYTDDPTKEVIVEFRTDNDNGDIALPNSIPNPPYCRLFTALTGYTDTIINVPYLDDELYLCRHPDYMTNRFSNWLFGGEFRELNSLFNMASLYTKNICKYNPVIQPSIQIYLPNRNKIVIDVQGAPAFNHKPYKADEIIFKRTYIGSRI
jgi:hypothetical protein